MQNSKKAKSWKTALLMVLAFFLVMAALAAAGLCPWAAAGCASAGRSISGPVNGLLVSVIFLARAAAALQGEGGTVHIEVRRRVAALPSQ